MPDDDDVEATMAATDPLTEEQADHLLRRAGFGPRPNEVEQFAGRIREQVVDQLLGTKSRKSKPPAKRNNDFDTFRRMQRWWLQQMRSPKWRLHEQMTLFWHDHFPSSYSVVFELRWLSTQNALFREHGLGNFRDLAFLVTRDAAMLSYLNGFQNRAENPNENYARELMELFVLGREDLNGQPNYTQEDVVQLARACTGFGLLYKRNRRTDTVILESGDFDAGVKTLFAGTSFEVTGNLGVENADGVPFPADRNVIDILFTHRDSDNRPTAARFIANKLWEWFAYPNPDKVGIVDPLADIFVDSNYDVRTLVRAILTHDELYGETARSQTAKTPVDFANQMILALGAKSNFENLPSALERMGMDLFNPPSVNGWNHSEAWLATARFRERFILAQRLASGRSKRDGGYLVKVDKLLDPSVTSSGDIVDSMLALFGVQGLPTASRQSLIDYLETGAALSDEEWLEIKFRGLLVLIFTLPEFQVH
jgi:uncharacterized protein (DUF1800 family)